MTDDLTMPQDMLDRISLAADLTKKEQLALSAEVWRRLEAQPGFNERLREAEADLEAGKGVLYTFDKLGRMRRVKRTKDGRALRGPTNE